MLASDREQGEAYARLRSQLSHGKLRTRLHDLLRATRAPSENLRQDLPALLLWLLEGTGLDHLIPATLLRCLTWTSTSAPSNSLPNASAACRRPAAAANDTC